MVPHFPSPLRGGDCQYPSAKGLNLIIDHDLKFAIDPTDAFGRLLWFAEKKAQGYPPISIPHQTASFSRI